MKINVTIENGIVRIPLPSIIVDAGHWTNHDDETKEGIKFSSKRFVKTGEDRLDTIAYIDVNKLRRRMSYKAARNKSGVSRECDGALVVKLVDKHRVWTEPTGGLNANH